MTSDKIAVQDIFRSYDTQQRDFQNRAGFAPPYQTRQLTHMIEK